MKLHEKIYHLRTEKKLSQGDLAEILDVSRQSVSKWETGASVPDLDKLVKMSDLFGVTMDFLVREEMEQKDVGAQNPIEKPHGDDEKGDVLTNTVIVKETLPVRKLFGALLFVSAFIFLFLVWPLSVFAVLLGAICFVFQKHTLLWCTWFTYFSLDIFLITGTGINRRVVFSPHAYSEWGVRILVHWTYLLLLVALIAWTVYTFRHVRYAVTPRRKIAFSFGWIMTFGVLPVVDLILSWLVSKKLTELTEFSGGAFVVTSELYEQYSSYVRWMSAVSFVTEWIQIIVLPILLVITVSWIRMRREKASL